MEASKEDSLFQTNDNLIAGSVNNTTESAGATVEVQQVDYSPMAAQNHHSF